MFSNELLRPYRKMIIFGGIGLAIILVIFLVIVPLVNYLGRPGYVDILVAPVDAKIMIDGEEYRNATYELALGEHRAIISRDGYLDKEISFNVGRGETTGLYTYLDPIDGDFSDYEKEGERDSLTALLKINGYDESGRKMSEYGLEMIDEDVTAERFLNKVTISAEVPIHTSVCGVPAKRMNCNAISVNYDYEYECGRKLCLIIVGREPKLEGGSLDLVRAEIETRGRRFDEYEYIYRQNVRI